MKYYLLFQVSSLVLALSVGGLDIQADKPGEPNLTLTIHCSEKDLKQGDEIPIVFTITNRGKSSYYYYGQTGYHNNDRRELMEQYQLVAKCEDGTIVPDPLEKYGCGEGGASPPQERIEPGESFSKTIALNQWALINKPGRYTITGIYYTAIYHLRKKHPAVSSAPIKIVVKPRTDRKMADYIKELSDKLEAIKIPKTGMTKKASKEIVATVKKLMYTCDPKIVPTLIDTMYKYRHSGFWMVQAFIYYLPRDPEIKNAVLETAKKRGLARGMGGMQYVLEQLGCSKEEFKEIITISLTSENPNIQFAGAQAAQQHPDDSYTSRLIDIATDANSPARWQAIQALAYNRTDRGVTTLKILLKDANKNIREATANAIRRAYREVPVYQKYSDDEYTSALIAVMSDPNSLKWMFAYAITEIAKTRTEEGVKAIKLLLEDPDKDIPIAKTDEAVKTIKNLLRNPDKNIRDMTAYTIRDAYKRYPGRPLREDDFPELFRESLENRKKTILEWLKGRNK